MADLRTKAVTPAAISYTPLDLSRVQAQLGQKVQEVEGSAAAARNLVTSLDFKDGYMLAGMAKDLQNEYSGKIQNLVDGLYTTGDTRSFSSDLSLLANQMNKDERVLAGQKDYDFSKAHDGYAMDPTKRGFYYGYTSDNSPTGDIASTNWKEKNVSPEDVMNFYKIYPGEDLKGEYGEDFADLNSVQFEQYVGVDPSSGMYTFKTTKGPAELPQGIAAAEQTGLTKEEAVAQALLMENPGLYRMLSSDYDKGGSSSAINYRDARSLSKEHFIGATVLENLPFLEDSQYNMQTPPTDSGGSGSDDAADVVPMKSVALATVVDQGVGSQILSNTGMEPQEFGGLYNAGVKDDAIYMNLLASPDASPDEIEAASFYASMMNDWLQYGDPQSDLYQNGRELQAAADEAVLELLSSPLNAEQNEEFTIPNSSGEPNIRSFVDLYGDVIGDQDPVTFFHKIMNTRSLLGNFGSRWGRGFLPFDLDDKEDLLADYDGYIENPALAQQLTMGIGFLSKDELAGVFQVLEFEDQYTVKLPLTDPYETSNLGRLVNAYDTKTDYWIPAGGTMFADGEKINRSMPFDAKTEGRIQSIKDNNPIAFNEMARLDMLHRSSMYHTDVLVKPGEIMSDEVLESTLAFTAKEFQGPDFTGTALAQNWELSVFATTDEGGLNPGKSSGIEQPRMDKVKGMEFIQSPYQEIEWNEKEAERWLTDFRTWGAGDDNDGKLNFQFHGVLMPGGRPNDSGLIISRTKDGNTTQFLLQPKTTTAMANNEIYKQVQKTRKNLTGKEFLPQVISGDAYISQVGTQIYQSVQEDVALRDVNVDYTYTDTKASLSGTVIFEPQENIVTQSADGTVLEVTNPYYSDEVKTSVVADIQEGQEVYRIRKFDGTGDIKWGEYLNNFQEDVTDPANTYLGVQDYKDFLISLYLNTDYINDNGGSVNKEAVINLLRSPTMLSIEKMTEAVNSDWKTITNIPITFFGKKDALYHFAGQPGSRGNPDQFGLPQSGYVVK